MSDSSMLPARRDSRSKITLRELEVLQRVISSGTAMNAARQLGITQSAVSRRLAQLEDRLGIRLFDRVGGRLVATIEALSISEQLDPVFDTLDRIVGRADADDRPHSGTLALIAPPTLAHHFLPPIVAKFGARNPGLQIVLEVLASDALVSGIAECRIDVGLADSRPDHAGIRAEPLISTPAVCLLPAAHALARRDTIRAQDLEGELFISLSRRHSSRVAIDEMFTRLGVTRRTRIEASTNVSVAEFVGAGFGVGLVNAFPIVPTLGPEIAVRPFMPELRYTTNFLMPSSRPPTAASLDFIALVRAQLDAQRYAGAAECRSGADPRGGRARTRR